MKKIGCVLAFCNNYGTMLQSYATLKKIQSMGYDCDFIRYKKRLTLTQKISMGIQFLRLKDFDGKMRRIKSRIYPHFNPAYRKIKCIKDQAFVNFAKEKLTPYFSEYVGFENLQKGALKYNAVLVGSDQIWSPMSLYNKFYNLLFVDDCIPKIAYASSFGVSEIPPFQHKATGDYLNRFSMIGVRESSGKKIVDSLSKKTATVVADPTMLLTKEEWEEEIKNTEVPFETPYILCYFLGKNKEHREAVLQLKRKKGYKIIAICHNDGYVKIDKNFGDLQPADIGPLEFLKCIYHASYVCTDSFHCTAFSILFQKQFMSFYRFKSSLKSSRNSRIDSILGKFNMSDRIYQGDITKIEQPIDYTLITPLLKEYRQMSLKFLEQELNCAK